MMIIVNVKILIKISTRIFRIQKSNFITNPNDSWTLDLVSYTSKTRLIGMSFSHHYHTSCCDCLNVIISKSWNNDLHTLIRTIFHIKEIYIVCMFKSLNITLEAFSHIHSLNGRFKKQLDCEDFWFMVNTNIKGTIKNDSLSLTRAPFR